VAAFRFSNGLTDKYEFNSHCIELVFLIYFLLQFFREYTPVGEGERSQPVRQWWKIILNYF
jgi:hypothetical protein